jgi:hypothetical protein
VPTGELEHSLDGDATEAPALEVTADLDQERAEHVRAALVEAPRDRAVDSRGQVVDASVPTDGKRTCASEELLRLVDEVELELGPLLGEAAPVAIEDVALLVVLAESVVGALKSPLGQVGPLRDRDDLH